MKVEIAQNQVVGAIFITNVIPTITGNVPDQFKTYETIEAVSSLKKCRSDTPLVRVYFEIDGAPIQWRGSVMVTTPKMPGKKVIPTRMTGSARRWEGYADVEAPYTGVITAVTDLGARASVEYTPAFAGPSILTVVLGANPGSQSEVKNGDTITISGTCDADATDVEVVNTGIFSSGTGTVITGSFSFVGTVSSRIGTLTATLRCKNAMGTYGDNFETIETRVLDQIIPTFVDNGTTFPGTQSAFKGIEIGTQDTTVNNATSVVYSSPHGDFAPTLPTFYEQAKTITCTAPGDYNDSSTNFRIVAYKSTNGSQATFNKIIEVADCAPTINIVNLPSKLKSYVAGDYVYDVDIQSSQNLKQAPMVLASIGVLAGFTGGPKNWDSGLLINDSHSKGAGLFSSLSAINNADIEQTGINIGADYLCAGFDLRVINFGVAEYLNPIGTAVYDFTKLTVTQNDFYAMSYYADVGDYGWSYTIADSDGTPNPNGDYIRVTGSLANTGIDTYTIEVQESAVITMVRPK